jgi:hypothetical protein
MAPRNRLRKVPPAITRRGGKEAAFELFSDRPAMLTEEDYRELRRSDEIVWKVIKELPALPTADQLLAYEFQIKNVIFAYRFAQIVAKAHGKSTFREIVRPISEVIEKLEQTENIPDVLLALGAPRTARFSPDDESLEPAKAQYDAMLCGLRKIRDTVPAPPAKRKGARKAHDLYAVVDYLADAWETFTGKPFTQLWEKGEPISLAAQFVHAIVKVADPTCLKKLPNVAARTVTNRRKASRKRRQPASRKRATSHL